MMTKYDMCGKEKEIMDAFNKGVRLKISPKWVVHSPSYCFISESKCELESIMASKPPYEYLNATYRCPVTENDYYQFWLKNADHVMKRDSFHTRIIREIF